MTLDTDGWGTGDDMTDGHRRQGLDPVALPPGWFDDEHRGDPLDPIRGVTVGLLVEAAVLALSGLAVRWVLRH